MSVVAVDEEVNADALKRVRDLLDEAPVASTKIAFTFEGVTYILPNDGNIERADGETLSTEELDSLRLRLDKEFGKLMS